MIMITLRVELALRVNLPIVSVVVYKTIAFLENQVC